MDISVLLEFFLELSKTELLLNRNLEIPDDVLNELKAAVQKRNSGLPIAYIIGKKEFYGFEFHVSPSVLIPKPDTEVLVENAVRCIKEKILSNSSRILTVCDMCTGSGCIGISVLKTLYDDDIPKDRIPLFYLVDISEKALDVCRKNIDLLLCQKEKERVRVVQSNLFELVMQSFDVVLTNPPYVPKKMVEELLQDGRNEPALALNGDVTENGEISESDDGLYLIRREIPEIYSHLALNGFFFMETGEYNAVEAERIAVSENFKDTSIIKDLEGQLRVVYGIKKL